MRPQLAFLLAIALGCRPTADRPELRALIDDRSRHLQHVGGTGGHHGTDEASDLYLGRLRPGGGLVLVDRLPPHLWWVDPAGRVRTDIARAGDGPRELRNIIHVGVGVDSSVAVLTPTGVAFFTREGEWIRDRIPLSSIAIGVGAGCRRGEWVIYGPSEGAEGPVWLTRYRADSGRLVPLDASLPRSKGMAGLGLGRPIGIACGPDGAVLLQWDLEAEGGLVHYPCEGAAEVVPGAATEWIRAHPSEVARWRRGAALVIGAGASAPTGMVRTSRGLLFTEVFFAIRDSVVSSTRFTLIDSVVVATATIDGLVVLADSDPGRAVLLLVPDPEPAAIVISEAELLAAMGVSAPGQ